MFQRLEYAFNNRNCDIIDSEFLERIVYEEGEAFMVTIFSGVIESYEKHNLDVIANFTLMFFWYFNYFYEETKIKDLNYALAYFPSSAKIHSYAPAILQKLQTLETFR